MCPLDAPVPCRDNPPQTLAFILGLNLECYPERRNVSFLCVFTSVKKEWGSPCQAGLMLVTSHRRVNTIQLELRDLNRNFLFTCSSFLQPQLVQNVTKPRFLEERKEHLMQENEEALSRKYRFPDCFPVCGYTQHS